MSTSHAISRSPSRWSDFRATLPLFACIAIGAAVALVGCDRSDEPTRAVASQETTSPESSSTPVTPGAADRARTPDDLPAFPEVRIIDEPVADPADESAGAHLAETAASPLEHPLLERVVLIGASLTQGFGATLAIENDDPTAPPTFVPISLGDAMIASMRGDFRPAVAQGDMFFFLRPDRAGERLATMAAAREPSLLVALDFLFWFGYGNLAPQETRDARLRRGFALLEQFDCPIVIADFPDLEEAVGRMISRSQIPTPEELELLNTMLKQWAADRGDVAILPLSDLLTALRNGAAVTIAGATWEGEAAEGLLQEDRMHGTPTGMILVIRQLLAEMAMLEPELGTVRGLAHDPGEALQRLRAAAADRIRTPATSGN